MSASDRDYKGFVSGMFSGMAKLCVGHPFDTIKVRLQTTQASRFKGPLSCLLTTLRREGVRGLYKGATPPLVGWMVMDSVMLGSLGVYQKLLSKHVYTDGRLPLVGNGLAGTLAGLTVSLVAAPVEHVKARLQVQYGTGDRRYTGPLDCVGKMYKHHGVRGVYRGLCATMIFRSFFFFWWSSNDLISRALRRGVPGIPEPAVNFWAGGLSAQVFWLTSYPSDVVKQRIMTDPLGGGLGDGTPRFTRWSQAVRAVYKEAGWRGYWRGFVPCFLRAFPANAMALLTFETVKRTLP